MERYCQKCGRKLRKGGLAYVVQIKVYADFDGVLPEPEEDMDRQFEDLLEQVRGSDPAELEKEIHEEYALLLCKGCRDRLVDQTRFSPDGPFWLTHETGSIRH